MDKCNPTNVMAGVILALFPYVRLAHGPREIQVYGRSNSIADLCIDTYEEMYDVYLSKSNFELVKAPIQALATFAREQRSTSKHKANYHGK